MIDRSNGVDKGVARRAGLVSQYIGMEGVGRGVLAVHQIVEGHNKKLIRQGKNSSPKSGARA